MFHILLASTFPVQRHSFLIVCAAVHITFMLSLSFFFQSGDISTLLWSIIRSGTIFILVNFFSEIILKRPKAVTMVVYSQFFWIIILPSANYLADMIISHVFASSSSGAVFFENVGCRDPPWLPILSNSHEVLVSHSRPFCDDCQLLRYWPSSAYFPVQWTNSSLWMLLRLIM